MATDLAVITDAGTPLVSDPGEDLVAAWAGRGGRVVPIPGASAASPRSWRSGMPAARWTFEGFLPRRGRERRELTQRIARRRAHGILFEAPGRAAATLADLAAACGADRRAALCARVDQAARGDLARLVRRAGRAGHRRRVARRGHDRGRRSRACRRREPTMSVGRRVGRKSTGWSARAGAGRRQPARSPSARTCRGASCSDARLGFGHDRVARLPAQLERRLDLPAASLARRPCHARRLTRRWPCPRRVSSRAEPAAPSASSSSAAASPAWSPPSSSAARATSRSCWRRSIASAAASTRCATSRRASTPRPARCASRASTT